MTRIEKLKSLVQKEQQSKQFSWLTKDEAENSSFTVCEENKSAPIKKILELYTVRKNINDARGRPITGFEVLIDNLTLMKFDRVSIQQMENDENDYRVFTDSNIEYLFGILKIPKNFSDG